MPNESFAHSLLVEVGGVELPADVAGLLTYAYVDDSHNVADRFVLRFRDPGRTVLAKAGFRIGAPIKLRVQTSDPGAPTPLMSGEVTAVECEIDAGGTTTEVRGLDHAHRLFRGRRVAAYPNMTLADVVRAVTQRAGLRVGTIDAVNGVGRATDAQYSQDNVSDWDFLNRLAGMVGAHVFVVDGALHFRLPEPPHAAPDTTARSNRNPLVLEAGRNLVSLRAGVSAADQVTEVTARGWDVTGKRALTAVARPEAAGAEVRGADAAAIGGVFTGPSYVVADPTLRSDGEVRAAAAATATRLGGAVVELDGVARGNPHLRAGTAVALANVGVPFDGRYTLSSTRHAFSGEAGYTTAFTVSGRADRSLYGLIGTTNRDRRVATGLVPAIVADVKDPQRQGRVRLTMPWLDGSYTTGWARVALPGAGPGRGLLVLPEVGDEVLVGFSDSDLDSAYVVGGLFNGKDSPPSLGAEQVDTTSGEVAVRALVTRTGHRLELAESTSGPDGILLSTADGNCVLKLDKRGRVVEITSGGTVCIKAENGLSIDAGNGGLELSGQSVSIRARGDVGIDATGRATIKGTAGAEVEGATVKVTGQGTAELTAVGSVTVRGGLVRIN